MTFLKLPKLYITQSFEKSVTSLGFWKLESFSIVSLKQTDFCLYAHTETWTHQVRKGEIHFQHSLSCLVPLQSHRQGPGLSTRRNISIRAKNDMSSSFCSVNIINKKEIIREKKVWGEDVGGRAVFRLWWEVEGPVHVIASQTTTVLKQNSLSACFGQYRCSVHVLLSLVEWTFVIHHSWA